MIDRPGLRFGVAIDLAAVVLIAAAAARVVYGIALGLAADSSDVSFWSGFFSFLPRDSGAIAVLGMLFGVIGLAITGARPRVAIAVRAACLLAFGVGAVTVGGAVWDLTQVANDTQSGVWIALFVGDSLVGVAVCLLAAALFARVPAGNTTADR